VVGRTNFGEQIVAEITAVVAQPIMNFPLPSVLVVSLLVDQPVKPVARVRRLG
jgi:hypothetical protein